MLAEDNNKNHGFSRIAPINKKKGLPKNNLSEDK